MIATPASISLTFDRSFVDAFYPYSAAAVAGATAVSLVVSDGRRRY